MELVLMFILYAIFSGVGKANEAKKNSKGKSIQSGQTMSSPYGSQTVEERKEQEKMLKQALEKIKEKAKEIPWEFPEVVVTSDLESDVQQEPVTSKPIVEEVKTTTIQEPVEKKPVVTSHLSPLKEAAKKKAMIQESKPSVKKSGLTKSAVAQGVIWAEVLGTPRGKENFWDTKKGSR